MLSKERNKALIVILVFVFLFAFLFGNMFPSGGDYDRHFLKASEGCENAESVGWSEKGCDTYPPLFHILAKPFAFNPNTFFYFVLFLIGIVTPLLLFLISKNWTSVVLYFSVSTYFYFMIDGIFAQALAGIFLLTIFLVKDWRIQLALVILSSLAHGHGFYLVLLAFLFINLKEGFLSCSATFGSNRPLFLDQQIGNLVSTGSIFTYAQFFIFFTRIFPFPFLIFSVLHSLRNRYRLDLLLMAGFCFVAALIVSHRIFYFIPLLLIPSLADFASQLKGKWRIFFWVSVLFSFIYVFGGWINFKSCLGFIV